MHLIGLSFAAIAGFVAGRVLVYAVLSVDHVIHAGVFAYDVTRVLAPRIRAHPVAIWLHVLPRALAAEAGDYASIRETPTSKPFARVYWPGHQPGGPNA
jgi:hypothetical protein